ncbi:PQQ-dependent sugar dehydrogenase [Actinophytocola algeriensis]|uniref:Glucose/arabinose dehydrogenase n=1 Tax=Actinophytocola algeriensis TaxID=1768010 RepID=A0A7W7Q540_9PSEU|nr:PQQ-dependent sugar dehydrogenase [Actinophytocola algeriensis]MBB4906844.1 glucose/arabinose dehydrogenase [Actinophytocola algeriensis]MBE1478325.1 glucose/arabinose dehydrogenase [Actinophytocola algeriensis]
MLTTFTSTTTAGAAVPAGFTDTAVISGLSAPTNAVFAPDGRVFVSEKSGLVKTFDSITDTTATVTADLRTQTQDFWDRGLLGLTLDPAYPTRPYLYVLYTYDAVPGGTAPRWGDQCPTPPGATEDGCVVTGRLSRLTLDTFGVATGAEQVLVTDWCQQYPSHSVGTVAFGPDGNLYVGGGDGASFNFADWGQRGNPCADPPSPAGVNLAPPDARGGALRSQSPRRPAGEPVTLDGTITRVHPDTGATQIVAYGQRNQFRFAFRPGTSEIWSGDVGWNTWEEINRITNVSDATVENFGWPCYEGSARQSGYDGANLTMCESLYTAGGQTAPYYAYNHAASVATGDGCPTGGSSIAGIAFETSSNYPAAYDGALFFADSSRGCIWAMQRGSNGLPNPATIVPFVTGVNAPVQVLTGPGGDLYYVALGAGQLRRVSYPAGTNLPPTAVATANPTSGNAPLTVQFTGSGSTDPEGGALTYAWDLDGDGAYDDSTAANPSYTYLTQASVTARLRVTDPGGLSGTASVVITVGNPPSDSPVVTIDNPTAATQWSVGQTIPFAGRAADAQDGTLPASALSWQLTLQHCTSSTNCHAHNVQSWNGISSGSFVAPDHEYPSFLDLTLRATDSDGNTTSQTVRLNPRTVNLTFTSSPSGARLVVGTAEQVTPFTRTVIVGSNNSVSAPSPQRLTLGLGFRFRSWSDGGAQTHNITAPATATTYRANFQLCLC